LRFDDTPLGCLQAAPDGRGNSPVQRSSVAILAATLINLPFGSLYAFSVFLKPLEQTLGASRSDLSIVFGIATTVFTLAMLLAPRLFAYVRAPLLIALCALSGAGGIALAAVADSLLILGIGYGVLFGIGGGVAYIALQQGVNFMLRANHGMVNGYIVSLYPAGAMIALPVFGWALREFGLQATLLGLAGVMLLTGALATFLVVLANMRLVQPLGTEVASEARPPRRVFWQMAVVFFLAASAGLMVLSQQVGIIAAYNGGAALAIYAGTAITGAVAAARLGGGWLLDRFSVPAVMSFAHVWSLIGAIGLTLFPEPWMAAIGLGMIGMGYGLLSGSVAGGVAYYWPSADYGRIASRLYIGWCGAALSLPVLAGYLFDLTGGYRMAIIVAGCGNVLGVIVALGLPRQVRRVQTAQ
jgi:OFA family oxalate/formate antiporter-like MFS transporter